MEAPVKVIYDDDEGVIDYMADLIDRSPLIRMDESLEYNKQRAICIVTRHYHEEISTVLIANGSFSLNVKENVLMLFTHKHTIEILRFFKEWMRRTGYDNPRYRNALINTISLIEQHIKGVAEYKPQT